MPFPWTINPYRGCSHACTFCFARPTHEYLDFNAGRDFEQGDRRQGQRARGAAGGAGAAVVEGRARRAGDEHRPVPVGRGPLQADARDLGGDAGLRRTRARSSRSRRCCCATWTCCWRSPSGTRVQRVPVGPDARREGVAGDRAAHAAPAGAARGGGGAQPHRHPDRGPDRAADAGDQRRAGSGREDRRARARRRGRPRSAARRCSCAARCATSSSTGCGRSGPDLVERYEELYRAAPYASRRRARRCEARLPAAASGRDRRALQRPGGERAAARSGRRRRAAREARRGREERRCSEAPQRPRDRSERRTRAASVISVTGLDGMKPADRAVLPSEMRTAMPTQVRRSARAAQRARSLTLHRSQQRARRASASCC